MIREKPLSLGPNEAICWYYKNSCIIASYHSSHKPLYEIKITHTASKKISSSQLDTLRMKLYALGDFEECRVANRLTVIAVHFHMYDEPNIYVDTENNPLLISLKIANTVYSYCNKYGKRYGKPTK